MEIIKEGVRIDRLFKHFKGNFKGSSYDSPLPPPMRLDNAKVCGQFGILSLIPSSVGYTLGYSRSGAGLVK